MKFIAGLLLLVAIAVAYSEAYHDDSFPGMYWYQEPYRMEPEAWEYSMPEQTREFLHDEYDPVWVENGPPLHVNTTCKHSQCHTRFTLFQSVHYIHITVIIRLIRTYY